MPLERYSGTIIHGNDGFESWPGKTKDLKIGTRLPYCLTFSIKNMARGYAVKTKDISRLRVFLDQLTIA